MPIENVVVLPVASEQCGLNMTIVFVSDFPKSLEQGIRATWNKSWRHCWHDAIGGISVQPSNIVNESACFVQGNSRRWVAVEVGAFVGIVHSDPANNCPLPLRKANVSE